MPSLYVKSEEELMKELKLEKPFQAKQIISWLMKGVSSWDEMSNLPLSLRNRLNGENIQIISSRIAERHDDRSAVKLLIELEDKCLIECVMLSDGEGRKTACISSGMCILQDRHNGACEKPERLRDSRADDPPAHP